VKVKGPDPIVITLEPVGSAAGFFRNGKSKKQRYRPAYTRNHIEAHGGEFSVPPKTDDYDPHVIEMNIGAKWRGLFGTRGPSGVIDRWRVEQGMATQTRDAGETTFGTQAP
jgi:hypothetical protein